MVLQMFKGHYLFAFHPDITSKIQILCKKTTGFQFNHFLNWGCYFSR